MHHFHRIVCSRVPYHCDLIAEFSGVSDSSFHAGVRCEPDDEAPFVGSCGFELKHDLALYPHSVGGERLARKGVAVEVRILHLDFGVMAVNVIVQAAGILLDAVVGEWRADEPGILDGKRAPCAHGRSGAVVWCSPVHARDTLAELELARNEIESRLFAISP